MPAMLYGIMVKAVYPPTSERFPHVVCSLQHYCRSDKFHYKRTCNPVTDPMKASHPYSEMLASPQPESPQEPPTSM